MGRGFKIGPPFSLVLRDDPHPPVRVRVQINSNENPPKGGRDLISITEVSPEVRTRWSWSSDRSENREVTEVKGSGTVHLDVLIRTPSLYERTGELTCRHRRGREGVRETT